MKPTYRGNSIYLGDVEVIRKIGDRWVGVQNIAWTNNTALDRRVFIISLNTVAINADFESGFFLKTGRAYVVRKGFESNGLTLHRDPNYNILAAYFHDASLPEGGSDNDVKALAGIPRKEKDRLFLDIGLYCSRNWRERLATRVRYAAIRANSILRG